MLLGLNEKFPKLISHYGVGIAFLGQSFCPYFSFATLPDEHFLSPLQKPFPFFSLVILSLRSLALCTHCQAQLFLTVPWQSNHVGATRVPQHLPHHRDTRGLLWPSRLPARARPGGSADRQAALPSPAPASDHVVV